MELSKLESHLIDAVLGGDAEIAASTVDKYFTSNAVFIHPLFNVKGKDEIAALYRFWNNINRRMYPADPGATKVHNNPHRNLT